MRKQIAQVTLNIAGEAERQGLYGASQAQSPDGGFGLWLGNILRVIMVLGVVACLGLIIWGAIEWITSSGDKNKTEEARNKITTAIIGLIVLATTVAIFNLVISFLGINTIKFV
jgi:F0F1-type ATP synthase membrane subunit c/vacuolar-type H+-ATPase subunit K